VAIVRIALLSDDRLFCDGVINILQLDPSFQVTSIDTRASAPIGDVDVVLVDSRLDGALEGCAAAHAAVLLVAAPHEEQWCRDALCAGASGVLPKTAGAHELLQAVRVVHEGSVWAPRRIMAGCIKQLVAGSVPRRAGEARLEQHLSRREREIFHQAAAGLANKELASRLAIGEATVKAHLTRIFQKLGVRGRAELAALYHGVTPLRREPLPPGLIPFTPPAVVRSKPNLAASGRAKK
jgi:DNA-binding NarL/FixJ family response regulator